jgi:hypothetical protein
MALTPGICTQAKLAWLRSMAQDDIWIALYTKDANLSPRTAAYTPDGEVAGMGYERGGKQLRGISFGVTDSRAWVDWSEDPRWDVSSIKAWGAMIYNRSMNDLALCIITFDSAISSTNAPWWLELPPPGETAIIRWA